MSASGQNFSGALSAWKDINLTELQKTMDQQGLELVENQKENVVGRKALADKTKEFRKRPDEEKVTAFKGLLKDYQTEIDNLTRRCKTSETAFLNVYKILAEAPDPFPLLDIAVDQTVKVAEAQVVESELQRIREENAELKARLNEIQTLENAKKKAETRAELLEGKMDAMIQDRVAAKENELNATYDERMMNYEERERDLQRQLALHKSQLRDLQSSTESTHARLFDHSERQDQEVVAKLAEMDLIVADLERANGRVAAVERRNEILRAEIEGVRSGSDAAEKVKALENQISELEEESSRLLQNFESQKSLTTEAEAAGRKRSEEASKEIASKVGEIEALRQKVKRYADYDEVKRELEILKYVEFAGGEDEDSGDQPGLQLPNPNADKLNIHQAQSLEMLLMAKNKRLLDDLTKFRIMHADLESALQTASDSLESCRMDLDKQRALNERLETDLLHINDSRGDGSSTAADGALDGLGLGMINAHGSGNKSMDLSANGSSIPFTKPQADTSILPIVTSQRDRFRQRNAELEEELRRQHDTISELRLEIKSLQADNMKLYEKVRYLQSYRDGAGSSSSGGLLTSSSAAPIDGGMSKYSSLYEASMNPFEAFRGREAARSVQALNPLERGVFVITRQVLGNRRARLAFIVYALGLHLLVLFTSYECAAGGPQPKHVPS